MLHGITVLVVVTVAAAKLVLGVKVDLNADLAMAFVLELIAFTLLSH